MPRNILVLTAGYVGVPQFGGCPRIYNFFQHLPSNYHLFYYTIHTYGNFDEAKQNAIREILLKKMKIRKFQYKMIPIKYNKFGKLLHKLSFQPYFYEGLRRKKYFKDIKRFIDHFCRDNNISLIYAGSLEATQFCFGNSLPLISDVHDAISLLAKRSANFEKYPIKKLKLLSESYCIKRYESRCCKESNFYIVNSSEDEKYLSKFLDNAKLRIIENGVDFSYFRYRFNREMKNKILVFTGDMSYSPNEDAALYFSNRIFPVLRDRYTGLLFNIVGKNPPQRLKKLENKPGITVKGFVKDIRPHIHEAVAYVSPLRYGTGMKNKILESMALGTPVLASPISCEGISVNHEDNILIANNEEEYTQWIEQLILNNNLRKRLSENAYTMVKKHYNWTEKSQQLQNLIETVI